MNYIYTVSVNRTSSSSIKQLRRRNSTGSAVAYIVPVILTVSLQWHRHLSQCCWKQCKQFSIFAEWVSVYQLWRWQKQQHLHMFSHAEFGCYFLTILPSTKYFFLLLNCRLVAVHKITALSSCMMSPGIQISRILFTYPPLQPYSLLYASALNCWIYSVLVCYRFAKCPTSFPRLSHFGLL